MAASVYLLRPDQYNWIMRMAECHNLGAASKTFNEAVGYELKHQRRAVEQRVKAIHHRRLEHTNWKRVRNCRLPDRIAREVARIAATHHVDFMDALSVIMADAISRINRDRTLEDRIFEAPRSSNSTATLILDLKNARNMSRRSR